MTWRYRFLGLLLVSAVGIAATCPSPDTSTSIPVMAPDVPPLNALTSVAIGITLDSVMRVRRAAVPALHESIGRDSVFYRFQGEPMYVDNIGPGLRSRVKHDAPLLILEGWRRFESDSTALAYWGSTTATIGERHGHPSACFLIVSPVASSSGSLWTISGYDLAVVYTPSWLSRSKVSGDRHVGALVRLLIGKELKTTFPEFRRATLQACPVGTTGTRTSQVGMSLWPGRYSSR